MNKQDKEYLDLLVSGIHAAMLASQDMQKVRDDVIGEKLDRTISLQQTTNGRVTKLEIKDINHFNDCPNVEKINKIERGLSFFSWFNTPLRVALFFALILFIDFVFKNDTLWNFVKRIFELF